MDALPANGSATLTGMPPPPSPPVALGGGVPVDSPPPASRRGEALKEYNRKAKEKSRAKLGQSHHKKPAEPAAPPAVSSWFAPAPAAVDVPGGVKLPTVRFKDGGTGLPDVIEVDRCCLETLLGTATGNAAGLLKDGRLQLLAVLQSPGTGRSLAADIGHQTDILLAINGVGLTPQQSALANLVVSIGVAVSMVAMLPKMSVDQANAIAPEIQTGMDAALKGITGGSH